MQNKDITAQQEALLNMQQQYLEALRSRENEVLQFILILASALGGFSWLMVKLLEGQSVSFNNTVYAFIFGTLAILLLLFLGAAYTLALGYNYRSVLLQLKKVEEKLEIKESVLQAWSKINCKYKLPEILKQFYMTYILGMVLVALSAAIALYILGSYVFSCILFTAGFVAIFYVEVVLRNKFRRKLENICMLERHCE